MRRDGIERPAMGNEASCGTVGGPKDPGVSRRSVALDNAESDFNDIHKQELVESDVKLELVDVDFALV